MIGLRALRLLMCWHAVECGSAAKTRELVFDYCLLYLFSPFNVQLDRLWPSDACALLPAVSALDEACAATVIVPAMENVVGNNPSLTDRGQAVDETRDGRRHNLREDQLQIARKRSLLFVG